MTIDRTVPYIDFTMCRPYGCGKAGYYLPQGYRLKYYTPGDEAMWAEILCASGEFSDAQKALDYFALHYADKAELLMSRMLFALSADGEYVGTTMAWYTDDAQKGIEVQPLIGWVSVKPAHQRMGIGKALVSIALDVLEREYPGCDVWLHTQSFSYIAVAMYRSLGFAEKIAPKELIPNNYTPEHYAYGRALVESRLAYHRRRRMSYDVISVTNEEFKRDGFGKANIAAVANYVWLEGYNPAVRARLVKIEGEGLALRMECDEENPKAVYENFFDPVYTDSAMEFFFCIDDPTGGDDVMYLNCEMNSRGTALMEFGHSKPDHIRLDRFVTPPQVHAGRDGSAWFVEACFSFELIEKLFGRDIRAQRKIWGNFYKCGDKTDIPHYASWSPIFLDSPKFHCPEFFGELRLDN